jgi:hypothetical protein
MHERKYGLLIFSKGLMTSGLPARLDDATTVITGDLDELVPQEQLEGWRQFIGTAEWDNLRGQSTIVFAQRSTERPEVSDRENDELHERVVRAWRSLWLIRSPIVGTSRAWTVTGALDREGRPLTVRTLGQSTVCFRPYYFTRPAFWQTLPRDRPPDPIDVDAWASADALLRERLDSGMPVLGYVAVNSFEAALATKDLDFKIPNFVRAAESILAIPRGQGAKTFSRRAIDIAPSLQSDGYVGGPDVEQRLVDLYYRRSECVHGRIPFEPLHQLGADQGADEAARLEYLAEYVARVALLHILSRPDKLALLADRSTAEAAWDTGQLP